MKTLRISKNQLSVMGSRSLLGMVIKEIGLPQKVRIQFQQSSNEWRKQHNGPDEVIVPEFVPMCLCQDILELTKLGYEVEIDEYFEN